MSSRAMLRLVGMLLLPLVLFGAWQVKQYMSRASVRSASISIDVSQHGGPLSRSWAALAQGGEEPPPMLKVVRDAIKPLGVNAVRIDHVYDYYDIVKQAPDGTYRYDFSRLDQTLDDISSMGATPYLSLSYMPSVFTASGSVIDPPRDWSDWKNLVHATIEHVSGKSGKNIAHVSYEIWNEPELSQFGGWSLGGRKDYLQLYYYAVLASEQAMDTQPYMLGGPAVGSYYPDWIDGLLQYVSQNNLRMDFYSWHRYHPDPSVFINDISRTRSRLSVYPAYASLPLVISEWGIESGRTSVVGTAQAAAFTLSTISQIHRMVSSAFFFEIKDGPPPEGGPWGMISHERAPISLEKKPIYTVYKGLSYLSGNELDVQGGTQYIQGVASVKDHEVTIMLSNYDRQGVHQELVPIRFDHVPAGSYRLSYEYPLSGQSGIFDVVSTNGMIERSFLFQPNSVLSLTLSSGEKLASFLPGRVGYAYDRSLVLDHQMPFVLMQPEFRLKSEGYIDADFKLFSAASRMPSSTLIDIPSATSSGTYRLVLAKQHEQGEDGVSWGLATDMRFEHIFVPFQDVSAGVWHHVRAAWSPTELDLSLDGVHIQKEMILDVRNGKTLTVYPVGMALDNLQVGLGDQQVIQRAFDGVADQ